jgi:hypothetical protein
MINCRLEVCGIKVLIKHLSCYFSIGTQVEAEHVLSRLWIGKAERTDSGNYSCTIPDHVPEDFPRATIRVHVVDGITYLLQKCDETADFLT